MRRFFIASTFMFLTQLYAMACGGTYPTYNYYMFSVLDYEYNPVNTNTDKFWADYSNGEVTEFDAEAERRRTTLPCCRTISKPAAPTTAPGTIPARRS